MSFCRVTFYILVNPFTSFTATDAVPTLFCPCRVSPPSSPHPKSHTQNHAPRRQTPHHPTIPRRCPDAVHPSRRASDEPHHHHFARRAFRRAHTPNHPKPTASYKRFSRLLLYFVRAADRPGKPSPCQAQFRPVEPSPNLRRSSRTQTTPQIRTDGEPDDKKPR
jgi:hypothetical protein